MSKNQGQGPLRFTHVGRRSGHPHDTVAMVLHVDDATGEAFICAGWGKETDWVKNLHAGPAVNVQIGRASFRPDHRFLTDDEAFEVAVRFRRAHPYRLRLFETVLGWGDLSDDDAVREFVRTHPFVGLRPAAPAAHGPGPGPGPGPTGS
ncbi:nitroreductase family deazaflavin-dependent oxidoreductase [Georgenia sp. EYE_87]|uniref:nitroreductase family deazaflavin-dependent oxidoreductase n=1 Tax=Georgenia sp. EYE_87 TaxID=2853448 RepID=UPI002003B2F9|nr:nitroreductase family deazaflavin-dependent oxidoreductase [Georgenia sp. EYE_87]MCK6212560.1 nitroreductase family deazaflavin-dependent oxidoreductase [Georgenia sp. EYE_87]